MKSWDISFYHYFIGVIKEIKPSILLGFFVVHNYLFTNNEMRSKRKINSITNEILT